MIAQFAGTVKQTSRIADFCFLETVYGFDIFVHKTVLQTFGQPVVPGAQVECVAVAVPGKGWRATEIITATPPDDVPAPVWHLATVKWFDSIGKGFGFVVLDDLREAFLHASTCHRSGFRFDTGPCAGCRVQVQVTGTSLKVTDIRHPR